MTKTGMGSSELFPCFRLSGGYYTSVHNKAAEASRTVTASVDWNELISHGDSKRDVLDAYCMLQKENTFIPRASPFRDATDNKPKP